MNGKLIGAATGITAAVIGSAAFIACGPGVGSNSIPSFDLTGAVAIAGVAGLNVAQRDPFYLEWFIKTAWAESPDLGIKVITADGTVRDGSRNARVKTLRPVTRGTYLYIKDAEDVYTRYIVKVDGTQIKFPRFKISSENGGTATALWVKGENEQKDIVFENGEAFRAATQAMEPTTTLPYAQVRHLSGNFAAVTSGQTFESKVVDTVNGRSFALGSVPMGGFAALNSDRFFFGDKVYDISDGSTVADSLPSMNEGEYVRTTNGAVYMADTGTLHTFHLKEITPSGAVTDLLTSTTLSSAISYIAYTNSDVNVNQLLFGNDSKWLVRESASTPGVSLIRRGTNAKVTVLSDYVVSSMSTRGDDVYFTGTKNGSTAAGIFNLSTETVTEISVGQAQEIHGIPQ